MNVKHEQAFFKELGGRLAQARKDKNMSQERLSELTGLDRVAIGYIEQGRRKPTVTTMYRLSQGLGLKLEQLFRGY
jgi:transcriptional regulator with XRE-family HTH domain